MSIALTIDVFSGRPNPTVVVRGPEERELLERLRPEGRASASGSRERRPGRPMRPRPTWPRATSILGDQGTELHDDELAAGLREQLAAELAAVERAEERLALGTYGVSIESGEPIRLEAHPTAERTAEEQARLER